MIGQHMIILHIGSWRFWLFIVTSPCNVMGRFSSSPSAMSTTSPSSAFLIKGTPMKLCFIYRGLVIGTKGFSVPCDLVRPKRAHLAMIITSHLANSLFKKSDQNVWKKSRMSFVSESTKIQYLWAPKCLQPLFLSNQIPPKSPFASK